MMIDEIAENKFFKSTMSTEKQQPKKWTNFKPRLAYLLQHSYSKAPVELEPKFGQIIHKTKPSETGGHEGFTTLVLTHGKASFSFKNNAYQSLYDLFLTVFWP